jgi:hypothetical protein
MITVQVKNLNSFLAWLGTCEHKYTISSMQGGFVHIKFFIEEVSTAPVDTAPYEHRMPVGEGS